MNQRDQRVIMNAVYTKEGSIRPEVLLAVETAIRQFPNMDAEWWLGGVVAIRALLESMGVEVEREMEDSTRSGRNPGWDYPRKRRGSQ